MLESILDVAKFQGSIDYKKMIALKFSIDRSDDFLKLECDETVLCMSSCLKENVPAACNDTVSADKFLLLFLSDDESMNVPSTGPIRVRLS